MPWLPLCLCVYVCVPECVYTGMHTSTLLQLWKLRFDFKCFLWSLPILYVWDSSHWTWSTLVSGRAGISFPALVLHTCDALSSSVCGSEFRSEAPELLLYLLNTLASPWLLYDHKNLRLGGIYYKDFERCKAISTCYHICFLPNVYLLIKVSHLLENKEYGLKSSNVCISLHLCWNKIRTPELWPLF